MELCRRNQPTFLKASSLLNRLRILLFLERILQQCFNRIAVVCFTSFQLFLSFANKTSCNFTDFSYVGSIQYSFRPRCHLSSFTMAEIGPTTPTSSTVVVSHSDFLIRVCENIPSLIECYNFVNDSSCGAVATFVGITRDNFAGKRVLKLSYEGYVPMAEKELLKLCNEAREKYVDVKRIAAVHILGDCPVGQASVILAVSSPHRRASIHCIEYLIDELKARIPIWKREVYEDADGGGESSVWKENVEWHEGKQRRVMVKENEPS